MRIWLRPDKLAKLGLTPADVISAIKEQNLQAPAGRIGAAPSPKDQEFTYTVERARAGSSRREEFENIIIRGTDDGRPGPHQGRRARRARLAGLQLVRPARRQARRRDGRLPAARRQPAPGRARRSTRPWRGPRRSSRRTWTTRSSTTRPRPSRPRSTRSSRPSSRRSSSSRSWCSSSCRTCGRRSSRS